MHLEDTEKKIRITTEAFIVCNNEILLFQRDSNSKVFPGYWSIPGGHIDVNEDTLSACVREIQEETGLLVTTKEVKLKYIALHNHLDRNEIWHIFGFLVNIQDKHEIVNSSEGVARWISLDEVAKMNIFPPVAYYLEHVVNQNSGLLYNASNWKEAKLVGVVKETKDTDY